MFKAIKDRKIIAISEKKEVIIHTEDGDIIQEVTGKALFPCMKIGSNIDEVIEDTEHKVSDYKHYNGEFTLHNIDKDNEEIRKARENAYRAEVDSPLMAEYNRKKTFNLFKDGEEKALLAEITAKVADIKARYPYPVEELNNSDSTLSEKESEEVIKDGLQE